MPDALSPLQLKKARRIYNIFNVLNTFSFVLVSGNVVTLFALKLGASSSFIGLISSFGFLTFLFMLPGRRLVKRFRIIGVFGWAWIFRYIGMIPVLVSPILYAAGKIDIILALIMVGTGLFNVFRGLGLIGNNPLVGEMAGDKDKGSFLVSLQILGSAVNIVASLVVAFVLGKDASVGFYVLFIAIGIATGIAGSFFLLKLPEPVDYRIEGDLSLIDAAKLAFSRPSFKSFIGVFVAVSFVAGMGRTFLIVYCKTVYEQPDSMVIIFTVVGGLGALAMGYLTRILVDRIGAKPLYVFYTAVSALSLIPTIVSPSFATGTATIVFLCAVNFLSNFGFAGEENAAQTYFFCLIPPEEMLDLAIVYYIVYGIAGALGSGIGGVAIDVLASLGFSDAGTYRIFYGFLLVALVISLAFQTRLVRLGAFSIRKSLGIIFSLKDLRAISLLNRLDRTTTSKEERKLLQEIGESGSVVTQGEIIKKLKSPRFYVRMEALHALEAMPQITEAAEAALMAEVQEHIFTTAYIAARVLGKKGVEEAIPILRRALRAEDYMLSGESMAALARLGDRESISEIEDIVLKSENPRLLTLGVLALERLGNRDSIAVLIDLLKRENPPAFLRDEIVLAMAGVLGMEEWFYPLYTVFVEDQERGVLMLKDKADELSKDRPEAAGAAKLAVSALFQEPCDGAPFSRLLNHLAGDTDAKERFIFAEAALDCSLIRFRRFKFFIAAWGLFECARMELDDSRDEAPAIAAREEDEPDFEGD